MPDNSLNCKSVDSTLTTPTEHLHLTPVSSLVHLRPQPHHIDATAHLERQSSAKENAASGSGSGAGAGSSSAGARAIHMTIKATADGDAVTTETMADRLRSVQSENWRRTQFTHENAESAWTVYNESLFLGPPESAGDKDGEQKEQKEKKDSDEEGEAKGSDDNDDLEGLVPKFEIRWGDEELLEAVSDIKKPKPKVVDSAPKHGDIAKDKGKQPERAALDEAAKLKLGTKTRGGGSAGARRGGRPRVTSSKIGASSSVNVD